MQKIYIEATKQDPVNIILSSEEAVQKREHLIPTAKTLKASAVHQFAKNKTITIMKCRDPDPNIPGFCFETLNILLKYN